MHQVTADKFHMIQGNLTLRAAGLFTTGGESHCILRNRKNPVVGDGNFMGVLSQIFNGIAKAVKGFLDAGTPVHFIKFAFVEPLGGKHHVSVHDHRTAIDWAREGRCFNESVLSNHINAIYRRRENVRKCEIYCKNGRENNLFWTWENKTKSEMGEIRM